MTERGRDPRLRDGEPALGREGAGAGRGRGRGHRRSATGSSAADGVILPGVGAFPKAMERVRELGLDELVAERLEAGVPVLGDLPRPAAAVRVVGRERGRRGPRAARRARSTALERRGLQGPAHRLGAGALGARLARSPRGWATETPFYFVHSFAPRPAAGDDVLGTAAYGERFACAVERDRRSTASSSTRRSRAPPACGCWPTSRASARRPGVILYPAIDIRGGKAVRLTQGDYERETAFEDDPVDAARRWVDGGPAGCTSSTSTEPGRASR